ncbi:NUDIX domain-containing protein [Paenibacillus sp. JX-17]|uniref:NUDIX domain-containing protein n=1 Tax=Paenibacillus lacisoli TaxID=3064525 RepID=A0ABT9C9K0_9BACL|nr:NUDIX domain-containing protein [Paenibacillus sp. JX-17]MDO7905911.1 NUDIX domain-containing protein [Paenibacillus sp. JX-17]
MKPIRNSAKAVILQENAVLLTRNRNQVGEFYQFPGGGQEKGEPLEHTVVRECMEEIGQKVEVERLLHVREYIGGNHPHGDLYGDIHQVEFYFACRLVEGNEAPLDNGLIPDDTQIGVEWVELDRLSGLTVYPRRMAEMLAAGEQGPVYLGDVY